MGFFKNAVANRINKSIREKPEARIMIDPIEGAGVYDGSEKSKEMAAECFAIIKMDIGQHNPRTSEIYKEVLQNSNLPIPLVAAYAFAIGEYIENPDYEPQGLNTKAAQDNANSTRIFFPYMAKFIEQRHSGTEATVILILVGNIIEVFIEIPPGFYETM